MLRSRALFALGVLALACGPASPPPPSAPALAPSASAAAPAAMSDADRRALQMGEDVLTEWFALSPELATMLRPPGATYDTLEEDPLATVSARMAKYQVWETTLLALEASRLSTTAARLSAQTAFETVHDALRKLVACRDELWTVSPTSNGWSMRFATYAELQPVGTDALRAQALTRFGKMGPYVDAQIIDLRQGLKEGYTAYEGSVRAVMGQLDKLLASPADKSPFLGPADRDGTPAFRAQLTQVLATSFLPAVQRYRDFLEKEYLPHARSAPGVAANPHGLECYRADLRQITTLDLDPAQAHQTGWDVLANIEAEMKALSAKSFGGMDPRALMQRLREDPQYRYKDRDEMMARANATLVRAKAAMPRAFGLLPPDDITVEPIPAFLEKTSAPHYQAAALDGSRPAAYRIRLYQPDQQSKVLGEGTAFHETIPGHHLQIDIALHRPDVPAISRELFNSGYAEGWGLYAEQLADELGLYSTDADRMGMLSNRAWRAVRVIVDTGMHALGWDRQKALDTMLAHTATSPDFAAAEVDRYIAWPGQACAYMMGYLEITRLRAEAQQALGARFDLRAFHDRVLEQGPVPLPALREHIHAWIQATATH